MVSSLSLFLEHSKHEFAHNNPIMTKIKTGHHHGKHRKTADQKHRKPSSQVHHLSGIQEGERENEDDSKERSQEPLEGLLFCVVIRRLNRT